MHIVFRVSPARVSTDVGKRQRSIMEHGYEEQSGAYQIQATMQNTTLRFKILDRTDGTEVLTGGMALDSSPHQEELVLLVKKYLHKFADLNP